MNNKTNDFPHESFIKKNGKNSFDVKNSQVSFHLHFPYFSFYIRQKSKKRKSSKKVYCSLAN